MWLPCRRLHKSLKTDALAEAKKVGQLYRRWSTDFVRLSSRNSLPPLLLALSFTNSSSRFSSSIFSFSRLSSNFGRCVTLSPPRRLSAFHLFLPSTLSPIAAQLHGNQLVVLLWCCCGDAVVVMKVMRERCFCSCCVTHTSLHD